VSGPLPPADLHERRPDLVEPPAGEKLHRFYTAQWKPIYFDRSTTGRFNAPDGSYGVLYAAREPAGAFAETFLRTPGRTLIDLELLRRKAYVRLIAGTKLTLIRLAGPGLARLGATAEVTHSGLPYNIAQAWSAALFEHPIAADGIAYHARHDDTKLCYALYDDLCARHPRAVTISVVLSCAYSILESPMDVENYVARLSLTPITDGNRTFASWEAEFDCRPEREARLMRDIGNGVFQAAFDALKQRFSR